MLLAQGVEHKADVFLFLFFFFLIECVVMRSAVSERAKREMQNRESERAKREKQKRRGKKKEKTRERERAQRANAVMDAGAEVAALRTRCGTKMSRENRRDTHNVEKGPMGDGRIRSI